MVRIILIGCAILGMAACQRAPDFSAVEAERAKPIHRHDVIQALVSRDDVVIAGTQDGAALVSVDAGNTWRRAELAGASLIGLAACPDGGFVGIDFYGRVWSTDAAAGRWQAQALDKPRIPLTVTCDSQGNWWVAGPRATIAVSKDRGANWTVTDLHEDAQLTALQFYGPGFGIVAGEFGLVATTTDGGMTWTKQAPIPGDFYPYAVLLKDAAKGWLSGIAGQVLTTADGGRSWAKQDNQAQASLYRLFMLGDTVYGVGAGGVVARLEGEAWRSVEYPHALSVSLNAATAFPAKHAIAIGGGSGVLRVVDAAATTAYPGRP